MNVTYWAGTEGQIFSPARSRKSTSTIFAAVHPSDLFPYSTTTRWICVVSQHYRAGFSRCSATLKTWGKTAWNSLVCPASAKSEENAREPARFTRNRLPRFCQTETDRAARRSLARLAKRDGDFDLACELWNGALGNSRHGYEAYEQLAIYYEHKARDPERARQVVRQAVDELRRAIQTGDIAPGAYREIKARFDRRIVRLERKNQRPLFGVLAIQAKAE